MGATPIEPLLNASYLCSACKHTHNTASKIGRRHRGLAAVATTPLQGFDHKSDYEQGREDALNGFPRTSTRPYYRAGYDRGLSEAVTRHAAAIGILIRRGDPTQEVPQ